jgi:hypothetical protein
MSSSKHLTTRLIIRAQDGEAEARRYAEANGWNFWRELPQNERKGTLRELIWRISSEVSMHYMMDDVTGSPYIYFSTPWPNIGISLVKQTQSQADVIPYSELLADFDFAEDSQDRPAALLRLALGSPRNPDDASSSRIIAGLQDRDDRLRKAAVYATTYTPSLIYLPLLRQISNDDPVSEIRDFAENVVQVYNKMTGGG